MSNYVTRVEVVAKLAPDEPEWLWTVRVFTAVRGEAYLRINGIATHTEGAPFSEKDVIRIAAERLDGLIEHALQMGPDE